MLKDLLYNINLNNVSDIHITSDLPVMIRVNGQLSERRDLITDNKMVETYIREILKEKIQEFISTGEMDCRYNEYGRRFRCNIYRANNKYSICMRNIKSSVPKICEITPNKVLYDLIEMRTGLILITGPTGSGKSTTIASMIEEINSHNRKHIITLEDPIEYEYVEGLSRISQREIGCDTQSYVSGIKNALRQDPDIIVIGEIRDRETMEITLRAAQTGHLVLSTLHNNSAVNTIHRILNYFEGDKQAEMRLHLASLLRGIISQRLLKVKDREERVAVMEVMVCTESIKSIIKQGNYDQINTFIQMGKRYGMQTFEMDLKRLLNNNIISEESYEKYKNDN